MMFVKMIDTDSPIFSSTSTKTITFAVKIREEESVTIHYDIVSKQLKLKICKQEKAKHLHATNLELIVCEFGNNFWVTSTINAIGIVWKNSLHVIVYQL